MSWNARVTKYQISAKAYSNGVTAGRFVKLQAAGVITPATAASDAVVGVCDTTAAAGQITSYAPVGAYIYVTSGEAIAVGDLLTAGTLGKAFVLDADDSVTQRIGAVALSAAGGADVAVRAVVVAGVVETKLATTGNVTVTGILTLPTTNALQLRDADSRIYSNATGWMVLDATQRIMTSWPVLGHTEPVTPITGNVTLGSTTSGRVYNVTADAVVTLPATAVGITYTFICDGDDGTVQITLSPNSSDLIRGQDHAGVDNTDLINTKTTAERGDFITIIGDGAVGWLIQRQGGVWEQ